MWEECEADRLSFLAEMGLVVEFFVRRARLSLEPELPLLYEVMSVDRDRQAGFQEDLHKLRRRRLLVPR